MVTFDTQIKKFGANGDKTGWTYVTVPQDIAAQLKPGNKKGFKVKGKLDNFSIAMVSLIPMGDGSFIIPLNAAFRKGIAKKVGALLRVQLKEDKTVYQLNNFFMDCLDDAPEALAFFNTLNNSHKNYFSKWIDSAKTDATRDKRIAQAIYGLERKMDYGATIRFHQKKEL
ncbi:YdeI/OmpD-associated family protein [Terrimonas rubra]|uniref:YdeI/OmpD-associated family protein n=1 Tax=Terrimonas rubra TaxID=1035890 RepID=A0ABW6ABA5_9BACT